MKPYTPQISWPMGALAFDATESQIFKFTFRDTSPSDTLNSFYIEYKENILGSTFSNTGWVISSNPQHTFNANTWSNGKQIAWRVKVKCSSLIESDWSDWVLFKTSAKPTCSITFPQNDNDIIITEIPSFSHSAQDQEGLPFQSYQYRVFADDGTTLLWTSDLLTDFNNLVVPPKGLLLNNTYYKVDVTVTDSDGLSTTSIKRRFYTNFPPTLSNSPDFTVTAENDKSRMNLKWLNIKSIPATYEGSGATYVPCKFDNGIEVVDVGEKVYWNIDIPQVFTLTNWFKSIGSTITSKSTTYSETSQSDFSQGTLNGVVVTASGDLVLPTD